MFNQSRIRSTSQAVKPRLAWHNLVTLGKQLLEEMTISPWVLGHLHSLSCRLRFSFEDDKISYREHLYSSLQTPVSGLFCAKVSDSKSDRQKYVPLRLKGELYEVQELP